MLDSLVRRPHHILIHYGLLIIIVCVAWYLSFRVHPSLYILAFPFIIWLQLKMFVFGHECLHHLLFNNRKFNILFGRLLCFSPILISFNKYQKYHLLHHKYLGHELDPDFKLYNQQDKSWSEFFKRNFIEAISLQSFVMGVMAYTDILPSQKTKLNYKSDSVLLISFWALLISAFYYQGLIVEFFLLWGLPLLFFPSVLSIFTFVQHGNKTMIKSNLVNLKPWQKFLFPMNIHLHGSHHEVSNKAWFELEESKNIDEQTIEEFTKNSLS